MPTKHTKISQEYYHFRCTSCKRWFIGDNKTMRKLYHISDDRLCNGKFERIEDDD